MRLAALDIGSNTVHVLVSDVVRGRLEDVAHFVEMPELGPQVARSGVIGSRARGALRAVRKVIDQARAHGYEELPACARRPCVSCFMHRTGRSSGWSPPAARPPTCPSSSPGGTRQPCSLPPICWRAKHASTATGPVTWRALSACPPTG